MIFVNGVQTDKDKTTEIQTFSRPLSLLENELSIQTLKTSIAARNHELHSCLPRPALARPVYNILNKRLLRELIEREGCEEPYLFRHTVRTCISKVVHGAS